MSHSEFHRRAVPAVTPLAVLAISTVALAEGPKVGTKSMYECQGPHAKTRQYELTRAHDGVLHWKIQVDGAQQWVEKPMKYRGLTLFKKRDRGDGKGVRHQSINESDFAGYEALEPGAKFSGKVDESHNKSSWTWNYYSVVVGERKQITHDVVGPVEVTTVSERRKVVGGDYQSELTVTLGIEPRASLGWTYKDRKGTETCKLVSLTRP